LDEALSEIEKIDGLSENIKAVIALIGLIGWIVGISIFVVGFLMIISTPFSMSPQYQMRRGLGLLLLLIGGIIILGVIIYLIRSYQKKRVREEKRDKKVDSMSRSDLANMFDCPSSGNKGAVYFIKLVKDQILVKQSCPTLYPYGWSNKVRVLRIPLRLKDQCVSHFRDVVFRCFKCGQEATVDHVKFSGPWTLIKLSCPTHGNNLPTHKIWSTVYSDISNGVETTP
jgi:uncharacterized membrane protein